jgi:hypothetical protein
MSPATPAHSVVDYAGVLELLLDEGATAPSLTPEVKASEAVLAVLQRKTSDSRMADQLRVT